MFMRKKGIEVSFSNLLPLTEDVWKWLDRLNSVMAEWLKEKKITSVTVGLGYPRYTVTFSDLSLADVPTYLQECFDRAVGHSHPMIVFDVELRTTGTDLIVNPSQLPQDQDGADLASWRTKSRAVVTLQRREAHNVWLAFSDGTVTRQDVEELIAYAFV